VPFAPPEDWAVDQVLACLEAGIVKGYPDGLYHPTDPVTRDQMAVYISRALATPTGDAAIPEGPATASFSDVQTSHWAYKYVEYAKSQHIVAGYPDGSYGPGSKVDRGQMSVYVARAIAYPKGEDGLASYTPPATATFPDVPADHWACRYAEYCKSQSIVGGYPDGTYQPDTVVTRDQMAVYVARAFKLPA